MRLRFVYIAALACMAVACKTQTTTASYTVGGTVIGLNGSLTLANNGKDTITVSQGSSFVFPTAIASGNPYAVTIEAQPYGQTCLVNDGTGTVGDANVTEVRITCVTTAVRYTIGGTLTGLADGAGTVTLSNSSDHVQMTANGVFVFPTAVSSGTAYSVHVDSAPAGWTCTVVNGSGAVDIKNISTVQVSCTNVPSYSLGGTMAGLPSGGGVSVALANSADRLNVAVNGPFTFDAHLPAGTAYNVVIDHAPVGWNCSTQNGNGIMGSANVSNVAVTCAQPQYAVQGTISGAVGPWVLGDGNTTVNLDGNTTFSFPGHHYGDTYAVAAQTLPSNQVCAVRGGQGTVTGNVNNVVITCSMPYSVSGTVAGATGSFTVALNGSATTSVASSATSFQFDNVVDGTPYNVSIATHPTGQKCTVSSGNGTVQSASVTDVSISCVSAYTVSGTFAGNANGIILRVKDGSNVVRVRAGGPSFSVPITAGNDYTVEAFASPAGQKCAFNSGVTSNHGTAIAANATGANITCSITSYSIFGTGYFTPITGYSGLPVSGSAAGGANAQSSTVARNTYSYRFTGFTDQSTVTVEFTAPPGQTCFMPSSSTYVINKANLANGDIVCK